MIHYSYSEDNERLDSENGMKRIIKIFPVNNDDASAYPLNDDDVLDVLPMRNKILFPGVMMPISVSRPKSLRLVRMAHNRDKLLAVCCQRNKDVQDPTVNDLYDMGTAARVVQLMEMPEGPTMVILEGLERIQIGNLTSTKSGLTAHIKRMPEEFPKRGDKEFLALVSSIKDQAEQIVRGSDLPAEAGLTLRSITNPPTLVNYICTNFNFTVEKKQQLLQCPTIANRALMLLQELQEAVSMMEMKEDIQSKTLEEVGKQQREYFLHQQLQTIQRELGETGDQLLQDMSERAKQKQWSSAVDKVFQAELRKIQLTPTYSPEFSVQQNYLETLLALPWDEYTEDNFDLKNAQQILDRDHFGLEKIKERIIEHLAVQRQLSLRSKKEKELHPVKSPILCLYGPPGVGKTSLGKSIAEALGRKYARISLGGLHDEAEIRGHRRTYMGAMPGRIIDSIRKVQSGNPVFVLDEIDKIGTDYKGDPTSALLEVLDPEQNATFHDNYLDIDYDLSKVFFIATANTLDTIPRPLLDRMEIIEMTGYLQEEKEEIAKRYLLPKQLQEHGIRPSQLRIRRPILAHIIEDYTRESGVRGLDRQLAAICRKVDTRIALEQDYNVSLTEADLVDYLGQPKYTRDSWETNKYIGVVTGLAWTQVGGEILFIESSLSQSKTPTLTLTGNLGDVMKESATIAMGYIKSHATQFGIKPRDIDTHAVHIHVPEGATPKDGPSAGITMTTALVSAFTRRKVRPRIAMTGEMTLRGKVLPIGGVKEKILAAKRAGITDLILCEQNRKDVDAIPEIYVSGLNFHYVKDIQEVIDAALLP